MIGGIVGVTQTNGTAFPRIEALGYGGKNFNLVAVVKNITGITGPFAESNKYIIPVTQGIGGGRSLPPIGTEMIALVTFVAERKKDREIITVTDKLVILHFIYRQFTPKCGIST